MNNTIVHHEQSLAAVEEIARKLAMLTDSVDCLLLTGDLGSGKTTFARAFITAISRTHEEIVSPTFTLVQEYDVLLADGKPAHIAHFDLYRIERSEALVELALYEYCERTICLVEWPQIIPSGHLPADRLEIHLEFGNDAATRTLTLIPQGKWKTILA